MHGRYVEIVGPVSQREDEFIVPFHIRIGLDNGKNRVLVGHFYRLRDFCVLVCVFFKLCWFYANSCRAVVVAEQWSVVTWAGIRQQVRQSVLAYEPVHR